jgi:hypothetical protein
MIPIRNLHLLIIIHWFLPGNCVLPGVPDCTTHFDRHLLKGIVNISTTYFNISSCLAILTADTWCSNTLQDRLGDAVLREIHDARNWPVLTFGTSITMHNVKRNSAVKPDVVILILKEDTRKNGDVLYRKLVSLSSRSPWNPRARYVIVSTAVLSSTRDQHVMALSALNISLYLGTVDAIFLIPEAVQSDMRDASLKTRAIDIFTLFPFDSKSTGSDNLEVTFLDRWVEAVEGGGGKFRNNANLFPSKSVTDLRGRNVTMFYGLWPPLVMSSDSNASARPDEGLEIRIMKTAAEITNFTLVLRRPQAHVRYDGYFGAQWLNTDLLLALECTWPHLTGAFAWFVPIERDIPRWQSLVKIFSLSFWLLVLLVYVLGSLTFWAFVSYQPVDRETASFRNVVPIFMNSFIILLSQSVYRKPKGAQARAFFLLWSFYCLQINNAYQSSLIGFLTNPGHLPRINDIDDLLESGIELGVHTGLTYHFNDTSDPRNKRILKSHVDCNVETNHVCLDRMAYRGDLAVAGGRTGLEFISYIKYMKNGKPLYVPFKDNIREGHMVIYLTKGSILLKRINSIVLRLQNSGLIDRWFNDIGRKFGKHFNEAPTNDGFCVLTMSHLQGAFYLLLLGVLLSIMACSLEIIHHSVGHRLTDIVV